MAGPSRGWRFEKAKADALHHASLGKKPDPVIPEMSGFASKLLLLWSSGEMSATVVQELAHLAFLDGAVHPEVATLASIGSWGQHPGNAHRDLVTKFLPQVDLCEAVLVPTFARDPKTQETTTEDAAVFLPHKVIHSLGKYQEFPNLVCASAAEEFWSAVEASGDPRLQDHPMCQEENWKKKFIPLWLHGDGVEFQQRDSLLVFSMGFLLCTLASLDSSVYLAGFPKSCTVAASAACAGTWFAIMRELHWSLLACFFGKFPMTDAAGNPSSDPHAGQWLTNEHHRFVLWVFEGDHEYFSNVLGLPHWRSRRCCWDCNTDVTDEATTWKRLVPHGWTVHTIAEVRATPPSAHVLFTLPGVTSKNVAHDALHVVFCKGLLSHLLGSVLHLLCWTGTGRQTTQPAVKLQAIWSKVQEFYSTHSSPTRLSNLRLKMFCHDEQKPHSDYAFLNCKGAETKHLLPALFWVMQLAYDRSELHTQILLCMEAMTNVIELWENSTWVLTARQAQECEHWCEKFLARYQWLNAWALREDRYLFHLVNKFHSFHHLCLWAKHLNPRASWCFKGEDFVGRMSTIASSVLYGVRSSRMSVKFAKKYRLMLHLRLTRGDI